MEELLRKAHFASLNESLRRNIFQLAETCEEFYSEHGFFLNFIEELNNVDFLSKEELLNDTEIRNLEQIYKNHLKRFLICHQIWQKFNSEYILLDNLTFKFVVTYEVNKINSYIKLVNKLEMIQAKVTVISKTLFKFFFQKMFKTDYLEK